MPLHIARHLPTHSGIMDVGGGAETLCGLTHVMDAASGKLDAPMKKFIELYIYPSNLHFNKKENTKLNKMYIVM